MKYTHTYESHKGGTASVDNLMKFHGKLMNDIKKLVELDNKWDFIGRRTPDNPSDPNSNIVIIDKAIKDNILNPKFRAAVMSKYKVDIPHKIHLQYQRQRKEEYRLQWVWGMYDKFFPKERNFELTIEIDTPKDDKFQEDNTLVSIMIWIKPNNKRKDYFEMFNKKIVANDKEQNMYILLDLIKKFGEHIEKDFYTPTKLSKAKIINKLDLRDQQSKE